MNKKFKECLFEVYLGEQAGEMIFESLLASVEDISSTEASKDSNIISPACSPK